MREAWRRVTFSEFLTQIHRPELVSEMSEVPFAGARWYAGGIYHRDTVAAADVKTKSLNRIRSGDVTYNRMWATKASFGVVHEDADGCLVTNDFPVFSVDDAVALTYYVEFLFHLPSFQGQAALAATGTTERRRLKERDFLALSVDLPPIEDQQRIVDLIGSLDDAIEAAGVATSAAKISWLTALDSIYRGFTRSASIESVCGHVIGGAWGEKPGESQVDVSVVGGAGFAGGTTAVDAGRGSARSVTTKALASRALRKGDIVLEVSGGSEAQPVGRVIRANEDLPETIPSNFMRLVRIDSDSADPDFVFWVMWLRYQQGVTRGFQRNTTGIRNLSVPSYLAAEVMFPGSIAEQQEFAATARVFEAESNRAEDNLSALRGARSELLAVLLSGEHEIPESYDFSLIQEAA